MRIQTLQLPTAASRPGGSPERLGAWNGGSPDLRRLLAESASQGVERVVLVGDADGPSSVLVDAIREARSLGIASVTLETRGSGIVSAEMARNLRTAGLDAVLVSVSSMNPAFHLRNGRLGAHPRHILRGIEACLAAGLDLGVRLPLSADLPSAAGRLLGLKHAVPALESFVLAPFDAQPSLPAEELASEVVGAWDAAGQCRVRLALADGQGLPPCVVELPARARRLLAPLLSDHEEQPNEALDVCRDCALRSRCRATAAEVARAGKGVPARPLPDARPFLRPGRSPGSRLHVLGKREIEHFFHVDYEYGKEVAEPTSRIGIIYRCNQVCTFCSLAEMNDELPVEKVSAALAAARARGSRRVILTGGEPTLSRHLVEHVRRAAELGFERVELQTNAVLIERADLARRLREAGLTHAQISLHGCDASVSDRLTAAPGTHARTVRGIDALLEQGVVCLLNHLIFRDNAQQLEAFVEFVHARWSAHRERLVIQFHSARNEFTDREEALRHIARYSEYAGNLKRAIDRARSLGYSVHDLQDPTGIPALCVLGGDPAYLGPILAQSERPRIHAWESEWMTRVAACGSCSARDACLGVPRYYLSLFGDSEFRAIAPGGGLERVAE
jgi:molybdenum cofactor biosynthesis enzyme MoaA